MDLLPSRYRMNSSYSLGITCSAAQHRDKGKMMREKMIRGKKMRGKEMREKIIRGKEMR
jgi:hypothetical protein